MSATNSGVIAEPGFSYANQLLFYSRDKSLGSEGEVLATGHNAVILAMNAVVWVSRAEMLGGARFSLSATLPISNNSLTSDAAGALSGGGGFADSYYQPFILGWRNNRSAIRASYGFLAPTGEFEADANSNVGSGYWTHVLSSGQTWYLTRDEAVSVSAFQMYEFHGTQRDTKIHPGQTLDLDYSITRTISPRDDIDLQVGLVGYGQWQTTDKSGSTITPEQAEAHYSVKALGVAANVLLPKQKVSLGFKYFKEFLNRSTFQGYSLQISGSVGF